MTFGLPRDPAEWIALALGVLVALVGRRFAQREVRKPGWIVGAGAAAAAVLSAVYVVLYLRGGPRIIDATSYWLEARALSRGFVAWPVDEPVASTFGRFLVRTDAPDGAHAAVLFPPGYPALLALGFLARAPLVIGPLLGAAAVVATHALARRVDPARASAGLVKPALAAAPIAVGLSVVCAAMRYHTADTMAHGLAAVCFASSLALAFLAVDALGAAAPWRAHAAGVLAGGFAGWLAATRPVSALALAPILVAIVAGAEVPARRRVALATVLFVGLAPGLALLAWHQRLATGGIGASSQLLYYAQSDGPPGCFRYGFGRGVGCLVEHGDFVRANLPSGFGPLEIAKTTLRRLSKHLTDAGNVEPFALLVVAAAVAFRRERRVRLLVTAIGLQVLVYAPFYFDGNYPGGGARLYADVLPLEHVAAALVLSWLSARSPRTFALAASLPFLGFALRTGREHAALRDREGGEPMFVPDRLADARVGRGLVFIDTDHGYNLAAEPGEPDAPLRYARFRGDDTDWMLWQQLGEPPAYRYLFEIAANGGASGRIVPALPLATGRIEGESLWPARSQRAGWAAPEWATGTCASSGRWLAVHGDPAGGEGPEIILGLPAPFLRGKGVAPRLVFGAGAQGQASLIVDGRVACTWGRELTPASGGRDLECATSRKCNVPDLAREVLLVLRRPEARGVGLFALDRLEMERD